MNVQKFFGGLILIGAITAATLPGRQTARVLGAGQKLISDSLHTAETRQQQIDHKRIREVILMADGWG